MFDFRRGISYSLRRLGSSPQFTLANVITLALGIGATTAVFALVDSVLIRPLPYSTPESLVRIHTRVGTERWGFSAADYLALAEQQTRFEDVALLRSWSPTLMTPEGARRVRGRRVTWTYFRLLGIQPLMGRRFGADEDRPGGPNVVIASFGFWRRELGGDPSALGRTLTLDGEEHEVIGVLPREVGPLENGRELFRPMRMEPPTRKGPFFYIALGRLRDGVEREAAAEELRAINERLLPVWYDSWPRSDATWVMEDLKESVVGDVGDILFAVLGGVLLLYLIACTNAANLLVGRATQQRHELSVRSALGASRGRLLQHLLSEAVLLAVAGAAAGLAIALAVTRAAARLGTDFLPRTAELGLSATTWLFFFAVTAVSVALFGLVPSLQASAVDPAEGLRDAGRGLTSGLGPRRLRRTLVASQFALVTPLLIGAGLLSASLLELERVDPGFDVDRVLTAGVYLPPNVYGNTQELRAVWDRLIERVRAIPGVDAVGLANGRPPSEYEWGNNFVLEDHPLAPGETQPAVPWVVVTSEYFDVLRTRLLEGRLFDTRDDTTRVVLVDRTWARRFFPGSSAVGRRFRHGACTTEGCPWWTVIGVVDDVRYTGLDDPGQGTMYLNHWLAETAAAYVFVRTAGEPLGVLPSLRRVIREIEPRAPIIDPATGRELIEDSLMKQNYLALLAGIFGVVALVLSLVGVYGVMAYFVQQHRKDIGIRLALGGAPSEVVGRVLRSGMTLVLVGTALGLVLALGLSRYLANLVYGVAVTDLLTFTAVSVALLSLAFIACFIPARRAARLDPTVMLRQE